MQQYLITKKNINYYSWIPSNYTFETLENKSRCYLLLAATPCCTVQWTVQHGAAFALFTKVNSANFVFFKKAANSAISLALYMNNLFIYLFFKKPVNFFFEKPVQLINFTCTVHVNVNSNFFKKKISLRWIKFICTVISIYLYCNFNFIPDNILPNFIARSKNHENCSSCRMNFVCNEIVDSLMKQ